MVTVPERQRAKQSNKLKSISVQRLRSYDSFTIVPMPVTQLGARVTSQPLPVRRWALGASSYRLAAASIATHLVSDRAPRSVLKCTSFRVLRISLASFIMDGMSFRVLRISLASFIMDGMSFRGTQAWVRCEHGQNGSVRSAAQRCPMVGANRRFASEEECSKRASFAGRQHGATGGAPMFSPCSRLAQHLRRLLCTECWPEVPAAVGDATLATLATLF